MDPEMAPSDRFKHSDSAAADALEAYRTFQTARSLLFWVLLVSLVGTAAVFWLVDLGVIDPALDVNLDKAQQLEIANSNPITVQVLSAAAATANPRLPRNPPAPHEAKRGFPQPEPPNVFQSPPQLVAPGWPPSSESPMPRHAAPLNDVRPPQARLEACLKLCNYLATFSALAYCLALLIGLKLALVGRLGGLADGTKAFFVALLVVVMIIPWQRMIAESIVGVTFGFGELATRHTNKMQYGDFWDYIVDYVLYYGRFVGLWALSLLLLLVAQRQSCQAARQVRMRLSLWEKQISSSSAATGEGGAAETEMG